MVAHSPSARHRLPESRVTILGEEASGMEQCADRIVDLIRSLPPSARVLAVVDENLDLPEPWSVTVSGSYAVQQARERLDPSEERRLLALVRSANDSPDDVAMYMERAHGFLPKCPTEPDRKAILRQWLVRHGTSTIKRNGEASSHTDSCSIDQGNTLAARNRAIAAAELAKVLRLLEGARDMGWAERWRWLHRIKGVVATMQASTASPGGAALDSEEARAAERLIATIELLRHCKETPREMDETWAGIKQGLRLVMGEFSGV